MQPIQLFDSAHAAHAAHAAHSAFRLSPCSPFSFSTQPMQPMQLFDSAHSAHSAFRLSPCSPISFSTQPTQPIQSTQPIQLLGADWIGLPAYLLPCLALPCLALPCLALPCPSLPCLALFWSVTHCTTEYTQCFSGRYRGYTSVSSAHLLPLASCLFLSRYLRFHEGKCLAMLSLPILILL